MILSRFKIQFLKSTFVIVLFIYLVNLFLGQIDFRNIPMLQLLLKVSFVF